MNVTLHPKATNSAPIINGAITEPTDAPALNSPCAIALSFIGNHSALLLTAPGQLPASEMPSVARKKPNESAPLATA